MLLVYTECFFRKIAFNEEQLCSNFKITHLPFYIEGRAYEILYLACINGTDCIMMTSTIFLENFSGSELNYISCS